MASTFADSASTAKAADDTRHVLIDALRGFALAGVLLVNLIWLSGYELLAPMARALLPTADFDQIALRFIDLFVSIKFITLFSLLFGLGFAMQLQRADDQGGGGLVRYARRLLVLLAIGAIHSYFIWWGDILLTYALVGLLMLPFARLPNLALVAAGLVIALLPPVIGPWLRPVLPEMPAQEVVYAAAYAAFATDSWSQTLSANIALANWGRVANWALVCMVLSRFLLGMWAGRIGILQRPQAHRGLLIQLCIWGWVLGIAGWILSATQAPLRAAIPALDIEPVKFAIRILLRVGPLALGIAYAATFALVYLRSTGERLLRHFAPVGRMALTHYLTQSLLGIAIFYGIGLGIGPAFGIIGVIVAWALIFSAQMVLSPLWLKHFRFGPVEWLWRWLTKGGPMPAMRV